MAAVVALLVAGCSTMPAPPIVSSAAVQTSGPAPNPAELIMGVDDLGAGFNPHTLADAGPVSFGVASIVLPSVFRPGRDGVLRLDRTLAESARVTGSNPFTVTYKLRRDASWSDGVPIAAEDFAYLADRMRTEPGVVNPAGYRLITGVNSRAGGKTVEVVFSRPYPGWTTLFGNLLPSHLLKDAPGGWPEALEAGIGVAGGPFALRSVDRDRGLAVLERNDRYWDTPAGLDRLVLRESTAPGLVSALGSGGDHLALLSADAIAMSLLGDLGDSVSTTVVPQPMVTSLVLRQDSRMLAEAGVRAAIVAALDLDNLVLTGTGNGPAAALRATSHVRVPPAPGRPGTGPAQPPDPDRTSALLTAAGYTRTPQGWQRDGFQLRLVIGAPSDRQPYPMIANAVARQLRSAGVTADVIMPTGDELYGSAQGREPVDLLVAPRVLSGDPATDLASEFGCPSQPRDGSTVDLQPANVAAFCDQTLQPSIDGVLAATMPAVPTVDTVDSQLWQAQVVLPLYQHAGVLVLTPAAVGVRPPGLLAGPFAGAEQWRRAGR
jgi:ABC-type transport system substrate-binding protein